MPMAPVLIAGCGDVGARLALAMGARGVPSLCLRRNPSALPPGLTALAADLADAQSLRAVPRGIRQLVFTASPDAFGVAEYRRVYIDGLARICSVLDRDRVERIILVSSSAVFGEHAGGWVDEETVPEPIGFNGRILLEAEHWLHQQWPGRVVVLRLAGLYGPRRTRLLDALRSGTARASRSSPFYVNRIHVDDAASAIAHLLQLRAPLPCYLGVDDVPLPQDVLYEYLARQLGASPPESGPPPQGIGNKRLRNLRLRASGWSPQWPDARWGYAALKDAVR